MYPVFVGLAKLIVSLSIVYEVIVLGFVAPDIFSYVIVYVIGVHLAQYSLSSVSVAEISVIAFPVKSSLSYHPANV